MKQIDVANISFSNNSPVVIIGGLNVIESKDLTLKAANAFVETVAKLGMPYVFKASFDKANRSAVDSYRGLGLEAGLEILSAVKQEFQVPVITDIHEAHQADLAASVCDMLQLPAFLARQTDLVASLAATKKPINIKKPQFIAPMEMNHIINKFKHFDNENLLLCERGSMFGYNNLVVDMLGMDILKQTEFPIIFDVSHSLQIPGGNSQGAGGRVSQIDTLMRAGIALGIAGLFVEAHPDPSSAKCDKQCALSLSQLPDFLAKVKKLDTFIKAEY